MSPSARLRDPAKIRVQQLLFDEENPRLSMAAVSKSQDDILEFLWKEMAVDEVALSIAANGYFKEEPLFVIRKDTKERDEGKQKYVVVEGNRRLAAVRLLLDDALRQRLGATELPDLSAAQKADLRSIPSSVFRSRRDLWEYFGFRHINGPKSWDAYSKARYVAYVREKYGVSLDEIARRIGDRHATVKRLYRGYMILEQAQRAASFSREDIVRNRFYFSHLYTAADQPEFQKFLGIKAEDSLHSNPVPKAKLPALRELMVWLYGTKAAKREPLVRTQNPDLNILREVISKRSSLDAIRAGFSLYRAHEIGIGDQRRFREALARAKEELLQAKATVTTGYAGESDLLDVAEEILRVITSMLEEMRTRRRPSRATH